jgi:hypothetical protein
MTGKPEITAQPPEQASTVWSAGKPPGWSRKVLKSSSRADHSSVCFRQTPRSANRIFLKMGTVLGWTASLVSLTLILAIQAINLTRRTAGVSVKLPVKMNFGYRPIFSRMRERQSPAKEGDIE